jgi:hypothetical protein
MEHFRMHPYSFTISLRADHPSRELSFLAEVLKLGRRFGWTVGDASATPKGTALGGTRRESYWTAPVTVEETSSEECQLEDVLERSVDGLLSQASQLQEFFDTGGSMNYFIGLFGVENYGLVFSTKLMAKLSKARIELQLDVYPNTSATHVKG